MDANERKWVENDLVYAIAGCGMTVLNELGHGLREKTYERALCIEFRHQHLEFNQQNIHPVMYRGEHIPQLQTPPLTMEEGGAPGEPP